MEMAPKACSHCGWMQPVDKFLNGVADTIGLLFEGVGRGAREVDAVAQHVPGYQFARYNVEEGWTRQGEVIHHRREKARDLRAHKDMVAAAKQGSGRVVRVVGDA